MDVSLKVKAQRIKCISRLLIPGFSYKWQALADYFIGLHRGSCMGRVILKSQILPYSQYAGHIQIMPKSLAFNNVVYTMSPRTQEHVLDTPVFLTTKLTFRNKPLKLG